MAKKGKGHHTGPIHHDDMTTRLPSTGKKDPHADPEHHRQNAKHGMQEGMQPKGGYDDEAADAKGGMADNEECY